VRANADENRNAELIRSTEEEKQAQVLGVRAYNEVHAEAQSAALERLQATAAAAGNVFAELMETVKSASLGRISRALYAVGGQYRRNM
jgi:methylmalonyl-CoA mutase